MILLNPGPANTTATVKRAMTRPDICPREREFGAVLAWVRDALTRVVHTGTRYTTVLLGGSGTAGVEAAISSSVPSDGRLLIIENGAYGARMVQIAHAYGIAHDSESFGAGGVLNPVEAIGALCRSRGVELIVDAVSSYAGIPIEIEALGADFLVSSSNKCIQGMAGLAFVVCKRERLERMQPIAGRSFYLALAGHHRFLEQEGQMQFTPPVQIVYALEQALKEYFAEGGNERHLRYVANWEVLDSGMRALGFRRLLPEAILSRILTCYLEPDHPRYTFGEMHDRLYGKGFTIYPGKGARQATFRLANMGNVCTDDMHAFLAAMTETIEEMGMSPLYSS
jgi:aspartate aminotransferase-like enzyme